MLFNAGCNEQKCFLLDSKKNLAQIRPDVFEKNAPMTSPSRKLGAAKRLATLITS